MQIGSEGTEAADWLRGAICPDSCHVHGRSDVDGSRVRVHHRHLTAVPRLRSFGVHLQFLLLTPAEGLGCAIHQIPNRDRRDGVTTFKRATALGPGFLTGSHATKIVSAAPFRPQSSGYPFLFPTGGAKRRAQFFRRGAQQSRPVERKAMIDRAHDLPITKQAAALNISRGSVYYLPRPVSAADLALMRRIDELHLEFPFAGSRLLRDLLAAEGSKIGRRHVTTLMKRMGIEALYCRPRTTKPEPGHKVYPYLLRGAAITRPNQVWAMDITYIPMARVDHLGGGFLRRDVGGGAGQARQAGSLQHRPGLAVHGRRVHRPADQERHRDQHGRQRCMARQRLRRAAVAQREIRGGVSPGLRWRVRGPRIDWPLSRLLQRPPTTLEP